MFEEVYNHLNSFLCFIYSLHAPDGSEEASNIPEQGKPELSESSTFVTDTVSHCVAWISERMLVSESLVTGPFQWCIVLDERNHYFIQAFT